MIRTISSRKRGFTLVELLVVIGIIAVLVGVLLPVLSKVQSRGRDLKCQANLRQIGLAIAGYVAENKGSYMYGFMFTRTNKIMGVTRPDWDSPDRENFQSWMSVIGKWLHRGKSDSQYENDNDNFPDILTCPEAVANVRPHVVSYSMNVLVAPDPWGIELRGGSPPRAQIRPPKTKQMLKDTVMVWDTCVFVTSQYDIDYPQGFDIDNQRFGNTGIDIPQQRFFSPSDPYSRTPPGTYGNNRPINLNVGRTFYNVDPTEDLQTYPYQGNLRFRHQNNTACNGLFVDGHIEAFHAKLNSDKSVASHDAIRHYFMIRYPTGCGPNQDSGEPF